MQRTEIEQTYKSKGLEVEYGYDNAGTKYTSHMHEKTYLYTVSGSIRIKIEDREWVELLPGQEFTIEDKQLHKAVVGQNGWEYIAAWDAEEAKKYEHDS